MMTLATLASIWGMYSIYLTVYKGIGTWGVNNTVGWGWAIINFVWWIGIGHAGTAFSIFLLILRQKWRTSINRAAEAMTVFAVGCAAIFPALSHGKGLACFFIFPYPNTRVPSGSISILPLFWDFIAISAYLPDFFSFWYLGMLPDFATIRDRSKSKLRKAIYGFLQHGMGRILPAVAAISNPLHLYLEELPQSWWYPFIPLYRLTLPYPLSRAGIPLFSHPILSLGQSFQVLPW